jgi:aryl-alcohol dehydrogenase-like predicted oxidoreductase
MTRPAALTRRLGPNLVVSALGYGAWGLSGDYGAANEQDSLRTLTRALDLGISLIDTADSYGDGHNERLVGQALRGRRESVIVATKFGLRRHHDGSLGVCGHPRYARQALEASLSRLRVDYVDLFYLHRVDPDVAIEDTIGAMAELVATGKVRHIGLCEVSSGEIRRAHAVHPLTAIQSEYSLWTREPEFDTLAAVRELGLGFVSFSPLGRGFLTGSLARPTARSDFRSDLPRFQARNFQQNMKLLVQLRTLAAKHEATPAQISLAWLMAQDVVPIPGTRTIRHLEENFGALEVTLTPSDLQSLDEAFPYGVAVGDRYPASRRF